jgi:phage FluMu gp28-like protein
LINRLPEELIKVLRLEIVRDTAKVIEFANGACIQALPATCVALRAGLFDYVFVDEAAHINSEELEGLLSQAGYCSQKLIVLSTPTRKKENNKVFKSFCENSEKTNIKWNDVPGRDSKWVEEQIAHLDYQAAAAEYFLQM